MRIQTARLERRWLRSWYRHLPLYLGTVKGVRCRMHRPVGADGEFRWCNAQGYPDSAQPKVGT